MKTELNKINFNVLNFPGLLYFIQEIKEIDEMMDLKEKRLLLLRRKIEAISYSDQTLDYLISTNQLYIDVLVTERSVAKMEYARANFVCEANGLINHYNELLPLMEAEYQTLIEKALDLIEQNEGRQHPNLLEFFKQADKKLIDTDIQEKLSFFKHVKNYIYPAKRKKSLLTDPSFFRLIWGVKDNDPFSSIKKEEASEGVSANELAETPDQTPAAEIGEKPEAVNMPYKHDEPNEPAN